MEFWGVEVKAGQSIVVKPESRKYLHLSQANLGEIKKGKANESVTVLLNMGDQKLVLGILSPEKFPNLSYNLLFEKEFKLSHDWKNGSVYFCGYQIYREDQEDSEDLDSDSGSEEEELPLRPAENGKLSHKEKSTAGKFNAVKPESLKKPNVKHPEPYKEENDKSKDDDDSDEDVLITDSSDADDNDDRTERDEETPKKDESTKKRLNESASKNTVPAKKAKSAMPEKTDEKNGGHTATPHPAKKPFKTPANIGHSRKAETPKSGSQFPCKSCARSFGSVKALQSHGKAKHGGK